MTSETHMPSEAAAAAAAGFSSLSSAASTAKMLPASHSPHPQHEPLHFSIPRRVTTTHQQHRSGVVNSSSSFTPATHSPIVPASSDSHAFRLLSDMDLATVSPLCRQLLETKKRMLSELPTAADDATGENDIRSDDDESLPTNSSNNYKQSKLKTGDSSSLTNNSNLSDALTPEAMLQRKAQRRREQVRAASRRCRDRQRRETEDLRKKVFQLEEFIAHTIKSYEWELHQQQRQLDTLARANEQLQEMTANGAHSPAQHHQHQQSYLHAPTTTHHNNHAPQTYATASNDDHHRQIASTSSVSPASVDAPVLFSNNIIKAEDAVPIAPFVGRHAHHPHHPLSSHFDMSPVTLPPLPAQQLRLAVLDQWRAFDDIDHLDAKVAETKAILSKILVPPTQPAITQKAFGWEFRFWLDGARYYAKSSKFFPSVRGVDIANRMHRIEPAKYIETFPEVYAKKVLRVFHDHLKIVETVKALPGKQPLGSVTVQFVSRDDAFDGDRCFFANRSVALPQSTSFGHHEECNGYAFEDTSRTASDGSTIDGCLVQGVGGYDSMGKHPEVLMGELAKVFSSVVLRWESLFVNDYIPEDVEASLADIELDFEA